MFFELLNLVGKGDFLLFQAGLQALFHEFQLLDLLIGFCALIIQCEGLSKIVMTIVILLWFLRESIYAPVVVSPLT